MMKVFSYSVLLKTISKEMVVDIAIQQVIAKGTVCETKERTRHHNYVLWRSVIRRLWLTELLNLRTFSLVT